MQVRQVTAPQAHIKHGILNLCYKLRMPAIKIAASQYHYLIICSRECEAQQHLAPDTELHYIKWAGVCKLPHISQANISHKSHNTQQEIYKEMVRRIVFRIERRRLTLLSIPVISIQNDICCLVLSGSMCMGDVTLKYKLTWRGVLVRRLG